MRNCSPWRTSGASPSTLQSERRPERGRVSSIFLSLSSVLLLPLLLPTASAAAAHTSQTALASFPAGKARLEWVDDGIYDDAPAGLHRRKDSSSASSASCLANTYSCADQGDAFDGFCCHFGQTCSLDDDNKPACCPVGYVCSGTVSSATTAATVSYVPDFFYSSFPYILPLSTALAGVEACDAALSQCSHQFDLCTASLESGAGAAATMTTTPAATTTTAAAATTTASQTVTGLVTIHGSTYDVTIVVPGQTTIVRRFHEALPMTTATAASPVFPALLLRRATTYAASSAASICSALSSQACGGVPASSAACATLYTSSTTGLSAGATATGKTSGSSGRGGAGQPAAARALLAAAALIFFAVG